MCDKIPCQYIFKRWIKEKMSEMDSGKIEQKKKNPKLIACTRYRFLRSTFDKIATMTCESKASSKLAIEYANELLANLKEILMEQVEGEI